MSPAVNLQFSGNGAQKMCDLSQRKMCGLGLLIVLQVSGVYIKYELAAYRQNVD